MKAVEKRETSDGKKACKNACGFLYTDGRGGLKSF